MWVTYGKLIWLSFVFSLKKIMIWCINSANIFQKIWIKIKNLFFFRFNSLQKSSLYYIILTIVLDHTCYCLLCSLINSSTPNKCIMFMMLIIIRKCKKFSLTKRMTSSAPCVFWALLWSPDPPSHFPFSQGVHFELWDLNTGCTPSIWLILHHM